MNGSDESLVHEDSDEGTYETPKYIKILQGSSTDELQRKINIEYNPYRLKEVKTFKYNEGIIIYLAVMKHRDADI